MDARKLTKAIQSGFPATTLYPMLMEEQSYQRIAKKMGVNHMRIYRMGTVENVSPRLADVVQVLKELGYKLEVVAK